MTQTATQEQEESSPGQSIPSDVVQEVQERDEHKCQVCGDSLHEIHHVQYRSQGGGHEASNLVCLCRKHHNKVHNEEIKIIDFDPENMEMTVIDKSTGELLDPLWFYDRPDRGADEADRKSVV